MVSKKGASCSLHAANGRGRPPDQSESRPIAREVLQRRTPRYTRPAPKTIPPTAGSGTVMITKSFRMLAALTISKCCGSKYVKWPPHKSNLEAGCARKTQHLRAVIIAVRREVIRKRFAGVALTSTPVAAVMPSAIVAIVNVLPRLPPLSQYRISEPVDPSGKRPVCPSNIW